MLFNSFEFLFLFLPVTLVIYTLLCRLRNPVWPLVWLLLASLLFYGWWHPAYVALLLISIGINFFVGQVLRSQGVARAQRKRLLVAGIIFNLGLLAWFKYADLLAQSFSRISGTEFDSLGIVLPLAISFFTFQQIAYLVDAYRGRVKHADLMRYSVFVAFFPQLIAGPIVHHSEMLPRLNDASRNRFDPQGMAEGVSFFAIGLCKKVVVADSLAQLANPVFSQAVSSGTFNSADYTIALLAFSLQIYFDFSAYSDMAIGLGRMFSVQLPINFNSPYKAVNIIDFWRRWHMTLSRFLKEYLYIPLGGNRKGSARRYLNLMITMLLGGLWHGAQWQFVVWGLLHGIYLTIAHGFHYICTKQRLSFQSPRLRRILAQVLTLLAVVISWLFFRATSISEAWAMLGRILSFDGFTLSAAYQSTLVGSNIVQVLPARLSTELAVFSSLLLLVVWVLKLPNSQQLVLNPEQQSRQWRPNKAWATAIACLFVLSVLNLGQINEFIYFQF